MDESRLQSRIGQATLSKVGRVISESDVTIAATLSLGIPSQPQDCHSEGNLVSAVDIALQRYYISMLPHNLPGFLLNDSVE